MGIEIFGHLTHRNESEAHQGGQASLDCDYIKRQAREHEYAGFDGVLVGGGGDGPDSLQIAALGVAQTEKLNFLIANRPGLVSPTMVARSYATLDQISQGRIRFHVISGRDLDGQMRYGDPLKKESRYQRTREFMQVVKQSWTSSSGFDYHGEYYQIENFAATILPYRQPRIPLYFAGNSDEAYPVGGAEADGYALYAQPLDRLRQDIGRIRAEAVAAGRERGPAIIVFVRLILGATDELAWLRAEELRALVRRQADGAGSSLARWTPASDGRAASVGDQKQVDANKRGERHDRALWTGLSEITRRGKSSALVGSPETVVAALLDYVDAGVSIFILDGFDRLNDVHDYGRYIIPALKQAAAGRGQPTNPPANQQEDA
ncbi:LLM class flavin-dependent oxidoreductase [Sodalis sp. RH21]|uniref:LLM class flavin-dependent oxidoreductase n=1 Tax=unclassified Sodalis (in: enterobacteria) TaxID=2636512 RepID=UPI0039B5AD22